MNPAIGDMSVGDMQPGDVLAIINGRVLNPGPPSASIAWLLWALGFSAASFGTDSKTRDAFDMVATRPRGDFVVVECTLGLLRADGKLFKLAARAAKCATRRAPST